MALTGYYGAKHYNAWIILVYLIIITLDWITRLSLYIVAAIIPDPNSTNADGQAWWWIVIIFSTIVDIWISKIVYKFWRNLKKMPILELNQLKEVGAVQHLFCILVNQLSLIFSVATVVGEFSLSFGNVQPNCCKI